MVNERPVHLLSLTEVVELFDEGVIAEDGARQAESVRRRRGHRLHQAVLHLLKCNVQRLALLGVGVQLVVVDDHVTLRGPKQ